jgi:hypothetical protein
MLLALLVMLAVMTLLGATPVGAQRGPEKGRFAPPADTDEDGFRRGPSRWKPTSPRIPTPGERLPCPLGSDQGHDPCEQPVLRGGDEASVPAAMPTDGGTLGLATLWISGWSRLLCRCVPPCRPEPTVVVYLLDGFALRRQKMAVPVLDRVSAAGATQPA